MTTIQLPATDLPVAVDEAIVQQMKDVVRVIQLTCDYETGRQAYRDLQLCWGLWKALSYEDVARNYRVELYNRVCDIRSTHYSKVGAYRKGTKAYNAFIAEYDRLNALATDICRL